MRVTAEVVDHGFDNQSDVLTVTPLLAEQLQWQPRRSPPRWSRRARVSCRANRQRLDVMSSSSRHFGGAFVVLDHGRRGALRVLFHVASDTDGFDAGVEFVITAMLQSMHFLYRSELGTPLGEGSFSLSPYEIASELS